MFKGWKDGTAVVDLSQTSISELPEMMAAEEKAKAALAEKASARQAVDELKQRLSTRNTGSDAIAILHARAKWSEATFALELAEEQVPPSTS